MKLCKDCKNRGKKKNCQFYNSTSNYAQKCKDFSEIKPTNADKIRAMSDKALAEFLPIVFDMMCQPTDECMNIICNRGECTKTTECALKWLQSEVE